MKIRYILIVLLVLLPVKVLALDSENIVKLSTCSDENSARFILNKEEIKVKFIGIQSEKTLPGTDNDEIEDVVITDYICSLLTNAKEIKLEYEPDINNKDKYGRILAWVTIDGTLLQEHLVEKGYAKVAYLYDDYKYNDIIKEKEKIAQEEEVGVWAIKEETPEPEKVIVEKKGFFSGILNFFSNIFESIVDFFGNLIDNNF